MTEADFTATTSDVLEQWPAWRNSLIVQLNRQGFTGNQIGDVLKEIQSYIDETGESPEEAFGDPKVYARDRSIAPQRRPIGWREPRTILQFAGIIIAGCLMVGGSILIMLGRTWPFDIPATSGVVAGSLLIILISMATPRGGIRDPQTGQSMMQNNDSIARMVLSVFIVLSVVTLLATVVRSLT